MKIKKQLVESRLNEDEKLSDLDPKQASTGDIADAVKTSVEAETDGKKTVTDATADKIAAEVKDGAKAISADTAVVVPAEIDMSRFKGENELTRALDRCLDNAILNMSAGEKADSNLLVVGLAGSGKTSIIKQWAKDNNVHLFELDAKNPDLDTIIGGMPVRDTDNPMKVKMAYTAILDGLDEPRTVLFLDELNRAKAGLRGSLLTFVEDHQIPGDSETGTRHFDNWLFTVAAINPAGSATDSGADVLSNPERTRFTGGGGELDYDSNREASQDYFKKYYDRIILVELPKRLKEGKIDEKTFNLLRDGYLRAQALALYLLNDDTFHFTNREEETNTEADSAPLNQRVLSSMITNSRGDVEKFLDHVRHRAGLSKQKIEMIEQILSTYIPEDIAVLKQQHGIPLSDEEAKRVNPTTEAEPEFEEEEEFEDDEGFFSDVGDTNTGAKGKSDVQAELENIFNTLNW